MFSPVAKLLESTRQGDLADVKKQIHGIGEHVLFQGDENGMCVLHHAALAGRCEIVEYILSNYPNIDVDHRANNGFTPAAYAGVANRTDIIQLLLEAGANPETCLNSVIDLVKEDVITFLCEASSRKPTKQPTTVVAPNQQQAASNNVDISYSTALLGRIEEMEREVEHWLKKSQELEEQLSCIICFENKTNTVFLSCAHSVACTGCAELIQKKNNLCPACEKEISSVLRIYRL